MFQRNIKMNKDDYPKLVKETGWHKFSTDVTTVASVHGIENVLNPTYAPVPTDPDEVALFHLQKQFFYNVLLLIWESGLSQIAQRMNGSWIVYSIVSNSYRLISRI